jgi:hypothetical protein
MDRKAWCKMSGRPYDPPSRAPEIAWTLSVKSIVRFRSVRCKSFCDLVYRRPDAPCYRSYLTKCWGNALPRDLRAFRSVIRKTFGPGSRKSDKNKSRSSTLISCSLLIPCSVRSAAAVLTGYHPNSWRIY